MYRVRRRVIRPEPAAGDSDGRTEVQDGAHGPFFMPSGREMSLCSIWRPLGVRRRPRLGLAAVAYLSLYRKYRPQTFAEILGQEHVSKTLTRAVLDDRVAHAASSIPAE